MQSDIQRFADHISVNLDTRCWEWTASVDGRGDPQLAVKRDGKWRPARAHRFAYEYYYGTLAPQDFVYRSCRNQRCVNPTHLRLRRNREQTEEMRAEARRRATKRSRVPRATSAPSIADIAWAAGFLEGEGNFRAQRGPGSLEQVRASQVNEEPLLRLVALFGGSLIQGSRKNPKHSPFRSWETCAARARGVMMTVYPFLSERKKAQVRVALGAAK